MNPLISIIVPVYNTEKYIDETIRSVVDQTYQHWELVLVDDGSTDQSNRIIEKWIQEDRRIRYSFKENGGQASARNVGIQICKGEYIAFLDADDLYMPERLQSQIEDIKNHDADFYYGGGYFFEVKDGKKIRTPYDWKYGAFTGEEFFRILYHSCAVNINTVLIKKDLLLKIGTFDESEVLRGTEDFDLWLRIALNVNSVYGNPERLTLYRMHDGGIHLQKANMLIGKWKIYEKYDQHNSVGRLMRLREYRYIFRELFNALEKEGRPDEIKALFRRYAKKDAIGFVAFWQRILINLLSPSAFLKFSNQILYRIGYRLEHLTYRLFIRNK
jgi:glycosyltransferase involved in cell wall biosynthesis